MRFRMDPRAKLYLLLLANLMLFFHVGTGAEAVATGLFLLLFSSPDTLAPASG